MKTIGEKLRDLRISKNMNQTEMGEIVGLSQQMVHNYETGKTKNPKISNLNKWSDHLELPIGCFSEDFQHKEISKTRKIIRFKNSLILLAHAGDEKRARSIILSGTEKELIGHLIMPGVHVLRVEGDSMKPVFWDGDFVIIDKNTAPQNKEYGAIKIRDKFTAITVIKIIVHEDSFLRLRSVNPKYDDIVLRKAKKKYEILGKIIYSIRRF